MCADAAPASPIIVLGALRTGTSVVAQMVHRWGAYAGEPEQLTAGNEHNPQGYWEYKPIWDLLVELGDFAEGANWWDPAFQTLVKAKLSVPDCRAKAQALIAGMASMGRPWLWKDPALSLYLPFWTELWPNPAYVITVRNPYDTAHSLQRFIMPPKLPGEATFVAGNLLRWQYMLRLILEHTEAVASKIFIAYEELVQAPRQQAQRLKAFLDQRYGVEGNDARQIDSMAQVVTPGLWRNRSPLPFAQVEVATNEQKALYQFLLSKVSDPQTPFDPDAYPMTPGWLEFINNEEALIAAYAAATESAMHQEP
jgi:hypothetical protein